MFLTLAFAGLLAWPPSLHKAAPPTTGDLYGDPLPPGAVARLGSVRLRHAGLWDFVCLPDGKIVLTAGGDRVLRFWDIDSGKLVRQVALHGRGDAGRFVTLSPDGKTLVTNDQQNLVFYDVDSGKELVTRPAPKSGLRYLYFSPDGKTLGFGRGDHHVTFLEWRTGGERELALPAGPGAGGQRFSNQTTHGNFSPDGKWFHATANGQEELTVHDLSGGGVREAYRLPRGSCASTASADSKTLAVLYTVNDKGGRELVFRLYDLTTGKERKQFSLGAAEPYYWLNFSPDGKTLACSYSNSLRVVDCDNGRTLFRHAVSPVMTFFSKDGKKLLGNVANRLRCWDAATGAELHDRPGDFGWQPVVAVSPDGRGIAVSEGRGEAVSLWDAASGRRIRELPTGGAGIYVRHLAFSAGGRTVTAAHYSGLLQSWDVAGGKELASVKLDDSGRGAGSEGDFQAFHLSADGKTVSTVERLFVHPRRMSRLQHWSLATGKALADHVLATEMSGWSWRRDGKVLAYSHAGGVALVDVASGADRLSIAAPVVGVLSLSPDERLLAALQAGNKVGVWETASGKAVADVEVAQGSRLALLPGSRLLLTVDPRRLRVLDLATGKERAGWDLPEGATASGEFGGVLELRLFPDGRRALTMLGDGTGLIWDLKVAPVVAGKAPEAKEMAAWWADLADGEARKAYAAVWRFADAPEKDAVGFLRRHLRPAAEADEKVIGKHIEDLDSDTFLTREQASEALEALGGSALPAMRSALKKGPSPEVRRRLEKLLAKAERAPASPEVLRGLRALQALEGYGSKEARVLLEELARGAPLAPLTVSAATALERCKER